MRDPRNVITSLRNHYELDYTQALTWMLDHKKYIYDYEKSQEFSDFQFISSGKIIIKLGSLKENFL